MGYRHSREEILEAALALASEDGLSTLTFGRIAMRVGTSDRIVVYYFPTKIELVSAVLAAVGAELQATLDASLNAPVADHLELVRAAWPVLAVDETDRVFAMFFEAMGLATAGREPYRSILPMFVEGWIDWTADHLRGAASRRRAEAEAAVAMLDGLLLLRQVAGAEAAERAARRMGV